MYYLTEEELDAIEWLKEQGKYDAALKKVNTILTKDPTNEEALLQVADIEYRRGEIDKATKAVDFLNVTNNNEDAMGLYIKGVLEMEKNERASAKKYFKEALSLTKFENHEIIRCYGLCEYRYGNREKGVTFIENAFELNALDAEIIYNLIELYLLEYRYTKAKKLIQYYYNKHEKLQTFDKEISYYDEKISLFESFVESCNISTKKAKVTAGNKKKKTTKK